MQVLQKLCFDFQFATIFFSSVPSLAISHIHSFSFFYPLRAVINNKNLILQALLLLLNVEPRETLNHKSDSTSTHCWLGTVKYVNGWLKLRLDGNYSSFVKAVNGLVAKYCQLENKKPTFVQKYSHSKTPSSRQLWQCSCLFLLVFSTSCRPDVWINLPKNLQAFHQVKQQRKK